MRKNILVPLSLGLILALAACAPQAAPTPASVANTPAPAVPDTGSSSSGSVDTITVANDPTLGDILVDSNGMTLYMFLKDNGTTTACTGTCAQNWPALTNPSPSAGNGVDESMLGTAPSTNQVAYNGHLLYTFVKDANPGDVNGEGLLNAWYAVSPTGEAIKPDSAPVAAPTQNGYDY